MRVDSIEQMLLSQVTLHQVYRGTTQAPDDRVDLLENGGLHQMLDIAVDARAAYDAISARVVSCYISSPYGID